MSSAGAVVFLLFSTPAEKGRKGFSANPQTQVSNTVVAVAFWEDGGSGFCGWEVGAASVSLDRE